MIDKEADGGHLILLPIGGGGSERQWDGDFWVHPLPPNGPVTFVASWLLYEVAELGKDEPFHCEPHGSLRSGQRDDDPAGD